MSLNPFTFGNPIKDPDYFYGQMTEIYRITKTLFSNTSFIPRYR